MIYFCSLQSFRKHWSQWNSQMCIWQVEFFSWLFPECFTSDKQKDSETITGEIVICQRVSYWHSLWLWSHQLPCCSSNTLSICAGCSLCSYTYPLNICMVSKQKWGSKLLFLCVTSNLLKTTLRAMFTDFCL